MKLYEIWIRKEKKRPLGAIPGRMGATLKEKLTAERSKLSKEKWRKTQELSTKEFYCTGSTNLKWEYQ